MQYKLIGNTMPAVEVLFDRPGESMYTQSRNGMDVGWNYYGYEYKWWCLKGCWAYVCW